MGDVHRLGRDREQRSHHLIREVDCDAARVEAGIDAAQGKETAHEQPGGDHQRNRETDFADNQQLAGSRAPSACRDAARRLLELFVHGAAVQFQK